MRKTHIFFGNQFVEKFNCDGKRYTRFQAFRMKAVRLTKKVMLVMFGLSVIGWSFYLGSQYIPRTVIAQVEVPVKDTTLAPVMQRIKVCEANSAQVGKDGQVIIHVNSNGSYDVGLFQINSIHNAEATKLGYDLTKEADNQAYAIFLYENKGTGDWYSSAKCWQK